MGSFLDAYVDPESRRQCLFQTNTNPEPYDGGQAAVGDCGGDEDGDGFQRRIGNAWQGGFDGYIGEGDHGQSA